MADLRRRLTKGGASSTPYLPGPTGPHPVGTTSVYLKDTSRPPDPWVPEVNARELMVSLWYPATSPNGLFRDCSVVTISMRTIGSRVNSSHARPRAFAGQ
jgi:hypothetical protein